mgnify:CR=1 FL=1
MGQPSRKRSTRPTTRTVIEVDSGDSSSTEGEYESTQEHNSNSVSESDEEPIKNDSPLKKHATKVRIADPFSEEEDDAASSTTKTDIPEQKYQGDEDAQENSVHKDNSHEAESDGVEEYDADYDTHGALYWEERIKRFFDTKATNKQDSYDRYKYLLNLNGLFRNFISQKSKKDKQVQRLLKDYDKKEMTSSKSAESSGRHRKSEKEEDQEMMLLEEDGEDYGYDDSELDLVDIQDEVDTGFFKKSPNYIKEGKLRDYQIQGLNWLVALHKNKLNGILADEMGLGKTLQTISFLGYLRHVAKIDGPFLVIAPKSTLDNWRREFAKWTPDVKAIVLQGDKEERKNLIKNKINKARFDVLIASFEIVLKEKNFLKKFAWQYLIIDEAHRIKNEDSMLSQIIRLFYSKNRLLITGTPLQNNLHELWALLNFILPDVFESAALFDEWFGNNKEEAIEPGSDKGSGDNKEKDQDMIVKQLRTVLSPFLLRRIKADVEKSLLPKIETNVYVGMTDMQLKWYKSLLEKDIQAVNGAVSKTEGKTRLLNIVMQLRKCCNHPYLFDGAEPGPPYTTDEHLVYNAGKMIALDKLLKKLKAQGSRVLIFSQMSRLLDIIEDYCFLREYECCRIDGSTAHEDRIAAIDDYNAPNSNKFIFLLTTRAGGLGINLVTADTVVLFDSDWNPQADLQAMDRAHRIGQKKQVRVYRFVTENAIEEKVLERAAQKLRLDQLVIQQGRGKSNMNDQKIGSSKDELLSMIQYGAQDVFDEKSHKISVDDDIEEILKKGQLKTQQLNQKYEKLGLDDLQNFNAFADQSAYEWNGTNFQKKSTSDNLGEQWINPGTRERKRRHEVQSYSVDDYYREKLNSSKNASSVNNTVDHIKQPKTRNMPDFQFFPPQLKFLDEKEILDWKRKVGYKVTKFDIKLKEESENAASSTNKAKKPSRSKNGESSSDFSDASSSSDEEEHTSADSEEKKEDGKELTMKEKIALEQQIIDNAPIFTEEDAQQQEKLASEAFTSWNKREMMQLINLMATYGKDKYDIFAKNLENKTQEEIENYCKVFWQRYQEIDGYQRYLRIIESNRKKAERLEHQEYVLKRKVANCKSPLHDLIIQYPQHARKPYSTLEDRFILWRLSHYGLFHENVYEKIRQDILMSNVFPFNWYLKTKTAQEISKRVTTLLALVSKEMDALDKKKRKAEVKDESPDMNGKKQKIDGIINDVPADAVSSVSPTPKL